MASKQQPLTVGRCYECRKAQQLSPVSTGFGFQPCECGSDKFWEINHYRPMKRPGSWKRTVRLLALKHSLFFFFGHLIALIGVLSFLLTQWIGRGVWLEMAGVAFATGFLFGMWLTQGLYES